MSINNIRRCLAVLSIICSHLSWSQLTENTQNPAYSPPENNQNPPTVQCDLIVTFKAYYGKPQRRNYIERAFLRIDEGASWEEFSVVDRGNRAYHDYPSDFDIIRLKNPNEDPSWYVSRLKHPTFKGVQLDKNIQPCAEELCERNYEDSSNATVFGRSLLGAVRGVEMSETSVSYLKEAEKVWKMGSTGSGVSVAVFDTGLGYNPHLKFIRDVTQWTDDNSETDVVGHGSFVASVIASSDVFCPGIAPDVELLIFKVFNRNKVSRTSWFLDAFNYAMFQKVDIINLSIGGPDFEDKLFVEKVSEIVASGIVFVSAIGNDGPVYGTLNNPADQMEVIGVGAYDQKQEVAQFSSRGMTTWEVPQGYGRVKPDVLALGVGVIGKSAKNECVQMQGTSVASPIVTGTVALILSGNQGRKKKLNPAFVKQVLTSTATRLPNASMFVQGSGKLNIVKAFEHSRAMQPHISVLPNYIDVSDGLKSDYFWPYSTQPLYYSALPVKVNLTIINSLSVTSKLSSVPKWIPTSHATDFLALGFEYLPAFWPWSGYLGVKLWVKENGVHYSGKISGVVSFNVSSYTDFDVSWKWVSREIKVPLSFRVVPKPRRELRILWDIYHNLKYPNGYFPRDDLKNTRDLLDWYSDHPHTNYRSLYSFLKKKGFFVELLGQSFECFDAANYQTLLIIDPEEEYRSSEIEKLESDVRTKGLSILVVSDWWNAAMMNKIQYFDENTKITKFPLTGGSNVPALNRLLDPYTISLSDHIYYGTATLGSSDISFRSASSVLRFPREGFLVRVKLKDEARELLENKVRVVQEVPIAGILDLTKKTLDSRSPENENQDIQGRIAVLTDASCLEDTKVRQENNCFSLFLDLLMFVSLGEMTRLKSVLKESSLPAGPNPFYHSPLQNQLISFSKTVLSYEPYTEKFENEQCENDEPLIASELINSNNETRLIDDIVQRARDLKNSFKNDESSFTVQDPVSDKKESPSAGVSYSAGMLPYMSRKFRADYSRKMAQQDQPWLQLFFVVTCGLLLLMFLCDMFVRRRRKRLYRYITRFFR